LVKKEAEEHQHAPLWRERERRKTQKLTPNGACQTSIAHTVPTPHVSCVDILTESLLSFHGTKLVLSTLIIALFVEASTYARC